MLSVKTLIVTAVLGLGTIAFAGCHDDHDHHHGGRHLDRGRWRGDDGWRHHDHYRGRGDYHRDYHHHDHHDHGYGRGRHGQ